MAAQLNFRLQGNAVAGKKPFQKAPRAGFALQQDQWEAGKLRQGIGPVGLAGIVPARHKNIVDLHAAPQYQLARFLRGAGKGQVYLTGPQHLQRLIAGAVQHLQPDGGIGPVEPLQVGQQQAAGHGVAGADDQLAHHQLPALLQLFLTGLDQADGAADVVVQQPPLPGQGNAARLAGKQPHLQLLFQLVDGLADRRLGNKQRFGGGGNTLFLRNGAEDTVQLQFDGHNKDSLHISYLLI